MIRQPIVILVGHIDHGKSSILEKIKGVSITKSEAGGITQSIRSYTIPLSTIKKLCGKLLENIHIKVTIPGLLFLDSPGHAAFDNMRKRGGNLADIAILVIDINEGVKEQTLECIEILKQYKTPFVIALNKIDMVQGWRSQNSEPLVESIQAQSESARNKMDERLYTIVGKLSETGLNAERFDRVDNYTKQIAIVPVSARTAEGVPELLMLITGLAQRFLEEQLKTKVKGPGKATILEVKEEKGLGITMDVIVHDGSIKVNDQIVVGAVGEPIVSKVRAIFEGDARKPKAIKEAFAAAGVRITATDIREVIGGMPLHVARNNVEEVKAEVQKEIEEVLIKTDGEGVIVKADTLGSVEAVVKLLREEGIKIKRASIGDISKKDIADAGAEKDPSRRVLIGFNVKSIENKKVKIITNQIIYRIVEEYKKWIEEQKAELERASLKEIQSPCKMRIMRGCVFRQSNPAVVGVHILNGKIKAGIQIMLQDGTKVGVIKSLQLEGEKIEEGEMGKELAVSIPGVIVGRQIKEEDILISDLNEHEFIKLKKMKEYLKPDEIAVLKEVAIIKRKANPVWGI